MGSEVARRGKQGWTGLDGRVMERHQRCGACCQCRARAAWPRASFYCLNASTGTLTSAGVLLCLLASAIFFSSPPSPRLLSPPGGGAAATGRARRAARYRFTGRAGWRGCNARQAEGRAQAACIGL